MHQVNWLVAMLRACFCHLLRGCDCGKGVVELVGSFNGRSRWEAHGLEGAGVHGSENVYSQHSLQRPWGPRACLMCKYNFIDRPVCKNKLEAARSG